MADALCSVDAGLRQMSSCFAPGKSNGITIAWHLPVVPFVKEKEPLRSSARAPSRSEQSRWQAKSKGVKLGHRALTTV
ncbi:hypothetical protein SynRS9902_01818 [Synechococcus sp. RS9902]|nr:hypothetical protein SynRS9902_01818 [Synechococcus sp. RS9902]